MDRFLLCENPLKDENRPVYIMQTIKHRMLIEVIPYDTIEDVTYKLSDVFDLFTHQSEVEENYMLKVVQLFDLSDDQIDDNIEEIRLHIKKAWKWYKSYIIWQDQQLDDEGYSDNFDLN